MSEIEIKKSNKLTLFNPAFIDDYGFNPEEFRVFARIMRRAGSEKGCTESIANMAQSLQMSERIARRAIRVLIACGAVARIERKGKTDVLDFNICDRWKPSAELAIIRSKIDSEFKKAERERKQKKAETQPLTPCGNATTPLAETQPLVVAETQPKGIPFEGTPRRSAAASEFSQTKAIALYRGFYPNYKLTPYQEGLLAAEVEPMAFRKALTFWAGKGYQERNLFGIFDRYQQELALAPAPAAAPESFLCGKCDKTNGLTKNEKGWTKCSH
jgi:predicted DNA-binding transcriptional regulator